jgi:cell division septum initiation protein DivIVA
MSTNPLQISPTWAHSVMAEEPLGTSRAVDHFTATDAHEPATQETQIVESATAEIELVAGAIEQLQERLAKANEQIGQVTAVRATELEIGQLFVQAQQFTDAALARLEEQIQAILTEAEQKAADMISIAQREADDIIRSAKEQTVFASTETAQGLQAAIVGFSRVNRELVTELGALNEVLSSSVGHYESPSELTPDPNSNP